METTQGLVIRIKGAAFFVESGFGEIRCSLRGRFRLGDTPEEVLPVVGDTVTVSIERGGGAGGTQGVIVELGARRSILARTDPSQRKGYRILGANMDQAILVFAVKEPDLNLRLLDRMLVSAACGPMDAVICVNKMDLADSRAGIDASLAPYRTMGYRCVCSSARTGEGVEDLAGMLTGKLSIFAGPSGSGKSSLISRVQPGLELVVGSVSARTGKGMHTTSHFEIHRIPRGGYLGDTPGVREFGIWGVSKEKLAGFFRDFAPFHTGCRFATCTHSHEPDCAVKDAVERGDVSRERYESYLRILETVSDERNLKRPW
ncbi:MAG: ribosome small subunit-dependent GTPase A [Candidatus Krumholzibacteriia bacterium]